MLKQIQFLLFVVVAGVSLGFANHSVAELSQVETLQNLSSGVARTASVAIDNGKIYVAFTDSANGAKLSISKIDVATFSLDETLQNLSSDWASNPFLAIDDGKIYVAFTDHANSFNWSISKIDIPTFSLDQTLQTPNGGQRSMTIFNGKIYVAFTDGANSQKLSVSTIDIPTFSLEQTLQDLSSADVTFPVIVKDPTAPNFYVAFQDGRLEVEDVDVIPATGNEGRLSITKLTDLDVGTAPDTTPPIITSTSPKDGNVDINPDVVNQSGIVITFDEVIDTTKIQIAVKAGDQPLTWQPTWSDGDTKLTLTPIAGNELGFETEYTVTLSQVMDAAGNTVELSIAFTTKAVSAEVSLSMLRAAYLFDEGSGTTALDQTGMFNGTIVGATYSTNAPHREVGNFSLLFNGNARVDLGPSSNFAFASISVELFVNPTAIKGGQRSGFKRANYALAIGQGSSNVGLLLGIDGDGQSGQLGDGTNTSYFDLFNPTPPIPLNTWTHLALTFDGSTNTGRLYVNGSLVASVQQKPITYNENLPARIGALSDRFPGAAWVGFIDEVKIYEGVRTEEQIASSASAVPKPLTLSFPLSLEKGLNMISLALKPDTPFTAKSFATTLGATVVIRHDTDQGRFIPYIPTLAERAGGEGFLIEGGMGYIVNVLEDKELEFTGKPWGEPVFQVPPIVERNNDVPGNVWAFVVSGSLSRTGSLLVPSTPTTVRVTNLRSGITVTATPTDGVFQAAFVDLNRAPVVLPGDTLEVVALGANGERVSGPFRLEVQPPHLRVAYLHTQMRIGDVIPEQTRLLANYPNPFNPETWIPYELAEAADVTLEVYNLSGRLVRRLNIRQKAAGIYVDKSRAIYWDGRNDRGERVSSGLYFYHFRAGEYQAVRRMVILK